MPRTGFRLNPHRIQLQSLKPQDFAPASSKATIECGYTLKRVRDMTRTYSQIKGDLD